MGSPHSIHLCKRSMFALHALGHASLPCLVAGGPSMFFVASWHVSHMAVGDGTAGPASAYFVFCLGLDLSLDSILRNFDILSVCLEWGSFPNLILTLPW